MLTAYGVTHPGKVRPSNEDSLHWDLRPGCSSSPTAWAGTRPAKWPRGMAVETVREFLESSRGDRDLTWPFGFNPGAVVQRQSPGHRRAAWRTAASSRPARSSPTTRAWAPPSSRCSSRPATAVVLRRRRQPALPVRQRPRSTQLTHDDSWVATVLAHEPGVRRDHARASSHAARAHQRRRGAGRDRRRGRRAPAPATATRCCSAATASTAASTTRRSSAILAAAGARRAGRPSDWCGPRCDGNASDNVTAAARSGATTSAGSTRGGAAARSAARIQRQRCTVPRYRGAHGRAVAAS